jgi:plastocyanin
VRQIARTLIALLGTVSLATAGNIDGKIVGWPGTLPSLEHPAVVWLQGIPTQAASQTVPVMAQRGGQFVPSFLVVVVGQTVSMPNEDDVAHNVYSLSAAKQFNLGYYAKGDLKTVTFDKPGIVDVFCQIHNFMRAEILVVPNPYYSTIAADGTFHIRHVPAGKFTLAFWGDGMASLSQGVTVPEGGKPLTVSISPSNTRSGK